MDRPAAPAPAAPAPAAQRADSIAGGADGVVGGADGVLRCWWGDSAPEYRPYHDHEWGFPVRDDRKLFEKLCLEGFQAGLSWLTVLRKREALRRAFAGFDPAVLARYGEADVQRLLGEPGIIRHRGKIEATILNARRALELIEAEGSLAAHVWRFAPQRPAGRPASRAQIPSQSPESRALAADLRRRGWRFVGPTTTYAFMQAMGIVNDHLQGCPAGDAAEHARRRG